MKRTFSAKRVPRKITTEDDNESVGSADTAQGTTGTPEPVVRRPVLAKTKKRSSLRMSFGLGEAESEADNDQSDSVTPKKPSLSRLAIEKNAERRARSSLAAELPQSRATPQEDRPSYSKDYIAELRKSTPSRPADWDDASNDEDFDAPKEIDIAAKFGPLATLTPDEPSFIPTEAEIREKKERRARLAKEKQAYVSLEDDEADDNWASDDDDEFRSNRNEISLRPKHLKEKYPETRLVPDDEDIAEGFEEYVEDGRITLGRKAEREAQKRRRAEMAELIADAEQVSDEDGSDDSEAERKAAYEAAQTRAGTYGQREQPTDQGARTPSRIAPLPDLDQVLSRLQDELKAKEDRKERLVKKMEELHQEKARITERQAYVQEQLKETGEKYEKLREEAGMAAVPLNGDQGGKLIVNRGLDSLGATPLPPQRDSSSDEEK